MLCIACSADPKGKMIPCNRDEAGTYTCLKCGEIVIYSNGMSRFKMQELLATKDEYLSRKQLELFPEEQVWQRVEVN